MKGEVAEKEFRWQSWVLGELRELFTEAKANTKPPDRDSVSKSISSCVNKHTGGNNREMARMLGVPKGKIRLWAQGQNLPELGALLSFCNSTGETLVDVLMGRTTLETKSTTANIEQREVAKKYQPRGWSRLDLNATRLALEDSIKNEFPPPSLKEFALRLNRTTSTLRYQFPHLCKSIVKQFRQHSKVSRGLFYRRIERALKIALKSASAAPTLEDLVRKFGCHRSVFISNYPDLCEALRRRNDEDRKNALTEIESLLFAAIAESPPCSFRDFCQRTGRSDQSLRESFPELCARISARYASYRSESFRMRREGQAHLVREIAYALHDEGVYPSVRNVQSRISSFSVRSCEVALSALRNVRGELQLRAAKAA